MSELQACSRCHEPRFLLAPVRVMVEVKPSVREEATRHLCAMCWYKVGKPYPGKTKENAT